MSSAPPMATPRVAAGVLFRDAASRVLLVKPTYKPGWDIPGGYVEPGESPKRAAEREVLEELGIEVSIGRLLVVDWAPHPNEGDKLLFIFDGGRLSSAPESSPSPEEIEDIKFWSDAELAELMPHRLHIRVAGALREDAEAAYLEHGSAPDVSDGRAGQRA